MSRDTPHIRNLARRLMVYERVGNRSSKSDTLAGFYVCEKLRLPLATFMGDTGFRALLSRSLALSTAEAPWLRDVRVKADWSLEGLVELRAKLSADEWFEGEIVLLAQLLGLLGSLNEMPGLFRL